MQIGESGVQIACKIAYVLNGRPLTGGWFLIIHQNIGEKTQSNNVKHSLFQSKEVHCIGGRIKFHDLLHKFLTA